MANILPQEKKRKYNEVVHEGIVQAVRNGNYRGTAARLMGINESTLRDWMNLAQSYREQGLEPGDPEVRFPEYLKLLEDLESAEAEFEDQMVGMVRQAALSGVPQTWQAAMTALERKHPEKWGKRDALKIQGDAESPLQVETRHVLDDNSTRELGRDLLRRLTAARAGLSSGVRLGDESAFDAEVVESQATEIPD